MEFLTLEKVGNLSKEVAVIMSTENGYIPTVFPQNSLWKNLWRLWKSSGFPQATLKKSKPNPMEWMQKIMNIHFHNSPKSVLRHRLTPVSFLAKNLQKVQKQSQLP